MKNSYHNLIIIESINSIEDRGRVLPVLEEDIECIKEIFLNDRD